MAKTAKILFTATAFIIAMAATYWIGEPKREQTLAAKRTLNDAGYSQAKIFGGQNPRELTRCDLGQVGKRGRAYRWETPQAKGLLCVPEDGRPERVLLEG